VGIRGLLRDRAEQRERKEWREDAERQRVLLENIRLRDGIIADRVRFVVEMGLSRERLVLGTVATTRLTRSGRFDGARCCDRNAPVADPRPGAQTGRSAGTQRASSQVSQ
jgi:hypothetical protein